MYQEYFVYSHQDVDIETDTYKKKDLPTLHTHTQVKGINSTLMKLMMISPGKFGKRVHLYTIILT